MICTRCGREADPAGSSLALAVIGEETICAGCMTDAEWNRLGDAILTDLRAEYRHRIGAGENPDEGDLADLERLLWEFEEEIEEHQEGSTPEDLRAFVEAVEKGIEISEAEGKPYPEPDLIEKAEWARAQLALREATKPDPEA